MPVNHFVEFIFLQSIFSFFACNMHLKQAIDLPVDLFSLPVYFHQQLEAVYALDRVNEREQYI